jgi:polysaccharide biosynthesis protein PelF
MSAVPASTARAPRVGGVGSERPSVLVTTEGTYPYVLGGVSTWCDSLFNGLTDVDWHVFAITAGGIRRSSLFERPEQVRSVTQLELWSDRIPGGHIGRAHRARPSLPAELARGVLGWDSDLDALREALVWCRSNPRLVSRSFRARHAWTEYLAELVALTGGDAGPSFDLVQAGELYQTLSWVARTASEPLHPRRAPPVRHDLLLVTAAGWAGIPAVIERHLDPRPLVLAEHGVYVREAYLQAARNVHQSGASRWAATRLARGLARLVYANADVVAPVTLANAHWERELGVADASIRTIYNGVLVPPRVRPFPARTRIVSVGRIDPLKDLATMLRCAALVIESHPNVDFVHYGPVPEGNERYDATCRALHRDLGLGDRFRFLGQTDDPYAAFSEASIALFSSISEGFPVSVLEAMACGRPVVSTAVGGIPEALSGCGLTVRPGDFEGLAAGVVRLLDDRELLAALGERSRIRVRQEFGMSNCLRNYRDLIIELTGRPVAEPVEPTFPAIAADAELTPSPGDHAPEASVPDGLPTQITVRDPA